ncbi:MAG: serine protease [Proteobacteria bacterium]|nr:MAG: serine protease [Pseudomonadota bacterium]
MKQSRRHPPDCGEPGLVFLSGPERGKFAPLGGHTVLITEDANGAIRTATEPPPDPASHTLAIFQSAGDSVEIESTAGSTLLVNGQKTENRMLANGDLVEIGNPPVRIRYLSMDPRRAGAVELGMLFRDCVERTRRQSGSRLHFVPRFALNMATDLSTRTTRTFRISVVLSLVAIAGLVIALGTATWSLHRQIRSDQANLEALTRWFEQRQTEYISRADLEALRSDLAAGLSVAQQRLEQLEGADSSFRNLIRDTSGAVIFLQGEYGFRDAATGKEVRYLVSPEGLPLVDRDGTPLMSLDGTGPVATRRFTGTGFVVNPAGSILTNRHVAAPWEHDDIVEAFRDTGIEPHLRRFRGYLPGHAEPLDVSTLVLGDDADLAILQCSEVTAGLPFIPLARERPFPGDDVVVLGYPTGLRALIARTSARFIEEIRTDKLDFWTIAERLAAQDYVRPLASRGIIGQISAAVVAYDADTTQGGSGGPVLNARGELIAVNNAILPEYGGSNLGVPVSKVVELMVRANLSI